MKKRIFSILLCLIMVLVPILASCGNGRENNEPKTYSLIGLTNAMGINSTYTGSKEYNSVNRYELDDSYDEISGYFGIKRTTKTEEITDEQGIMSIATTVTITVKSIRTGATLYESSYKLGNEDVGELSLVTAILGEQYSALSEKYFAVSETRNQEEDGKERAISIYDENGRMLVSVSGTQKELEEKAKYVEGFYNEALFLTTQNHIMIVNELYRIESNGEIVFVKEFKNSPLFEYDRSDFIYTNGVYLQIDKSAEGKVSIYTYDKSLSFLRAKEIYAPVGYELSILGSTAPENIIYILEKIVDANALKEGEAYDFIVDGKAYTRDFYIYNVLDGTTAQAPDILFLSDENAQLFTEQMFEQLSALLGLDINIKFPDGIGAILKSDLVCENGLYIKKANVLLLDKNLNLVQAISDEIDGASSYEIKHLLSNKNAILSLPWGLALYNEQGKRLASIEEEVYAITSNAIVTESGIYTLDYSLAYAFEENETFVRVSSDNVYFTRKVEAEEEGERNKVEYYSYNGVEKKLIFTAEEGSSNQVLFRSKYYYTIEYSTEESEAGITTTKCITTYYFYNDTKIAHYVSNDYAREYTESFDTGMLITLEKEGEQGEKIYEYTFVSYIELVPKV